MTSTRGPWTDRLTGSIGSGRRRREPTGVAGAGAKQGSSRADGGGRLAVTAALTAVTLVTAAGLGRLFNGSSYLAPVLIAGGATHAMAWLLRRTRCPVVPAALVTAAFIVLIGTWLVFPHATTWGLPDGYTWHTVTSALTRARRDFQTMRSPVPATPGFLFLSVLAIGGAAAAADAAALRVGPAIEGVLPSFAIFIFTAGLGVRSGRSLAVALWLAAVLVFLLVAETDYRTTVLGRFATGSRGRAALLAGGASLSALAIVGALVIGPSLPGAGAAALVEWHNQPTGPSQRTAVSPLVDIRSQLLKPSSVKVFRVSSPVPSYWRLMALDTFNGTTWSANQAYSPVSGSLPGAGATVPERQREIRESFKIQGLDSAWLPAAYRAVAISGVPGASFNWQSGSLYDAGATTYGERYTVVSEIPDFTPAELQQARLDVADPAVRPYLRLPASLPASVRSLAHQVVRGKTTLYEKALALQNYFRRNFTYSLDVQASNDNNAIVNFLFHTRKGYCQQFAGTYAVMARAVGLPSRVAVGFTPGQLLANGSYQVRALDAHAWPEVYLGQFGWVPFEPTPGRGEPGTEAYTHVQPAQAISIRKPAATTARRSSAVPSTTTTTTSSGGGSRGAHLHSRFGITHIPGANGGSTTNVAHHHGSALPDLGWALLGLLGLLALAVASVPVVDRARLRRRRARARTDPDRVLVAFAEATEALELAGWSRHPAETFAHYARRVSKYLPGGGGRAFTELAEQAQVAAFARLDGDGAGPDGDGAGPDGDGAGPDGDGRSGAGARGQADDGVGEARPTGRPDQGPRALVEGPAAVRAATSAAARVRHSIWDEASRHQRIGWRLDPRLALGLGPGWSRRARGAGALTVSEPGILTKEPLTALSPEVEVTTTAVATRRRR